MTSRFIQVVVNSRISFFPMAEYYSILYVCVYIYIYLLNSFTDGHNRYLHFHVHCSIINNSKDMEKRPNFIYIKILVPQVSLLG